MTRKAVIIGFGTMAKNHARVLNATGKEHDAELVAFSRTDKPIVTDFGVIPSKEAAELKISQANDQLRKLIDHELRGYSDYREMIDKERPDIAFICSPDEFHLENIKYCIENKVTGIYCEKPLALPSQVREARKLLLRIARKNDINFGLNLQLSAIPLAVKDKKLFPGKNYEEIVQSAQSFEVAWSSALKEKEDDMHMMDSIYTITDLGPHVFSLIPNIFSSIPHKKRKRKTVLVDDYKKDKKEVTIKFQNGQITLSRKTTKDEANKNRKWNFYDGGDHEFNYEWRDGNCFLVHTYNSADIDTIQIEDPLSLSIKSFLKRKPIVGISRALDNLYNLEAVVEAHELYNAAKRAFKAKLGILGKENYELMFRAYWPCLNAVIKEEVLEDKEFKEYATYHPEILKEVVRYVPRSSGEEIKDLASKIYDDKISKDKIKGLHDLIKSNIFDYLGLKKLKTA